MQQNIVEKKNRLSYIIIWNKVYLASLKSCLAKLNSDELKTVPDNLDNSSIFRMRGQKGHCYCVFHITSTNVGTQPKYFLIFSFNHTGAMLVYNLKAIPSCSTKLLNPKQLEPFLIQYL